MKTLLLLFVLLLLSTGVQGEFTCLDGTSPACLDDGDTVCPATAKCVGDDAVCFDKSSCASDKGFVCGSQYDDFLDDYKKVVAQYNELTSENVDLREERLEQRNCVINAHSLKDAIRCVR
ncbi:MAG: hypothetical protein OEU84_10925 [Xanthomonadales bacterium]|jgi:hypothetical protein|nr:hypothetical protein [Xanthomonadales bacterium]MDH4020103.1 hypothetical protein [Xanthomonadales bacterium]